MRKTKQINKILLVLRKVDQAPAEKVAHKFLLDALLKRAYFSKFKAIER